MNRRLAALLKVRTAARFDFSIPWEKRKATREEAEVEQKASFVRLKPNDLLDLEAEGLLAREHGSRYVLTDAGRAEIERLLAAR